MLGIRTVDADSPKEVGVVGTGVHAFVVEYFADFNAATQQLGASGFEIGDDQVQALRGTGGRRSDVLAKDDGAAGARRRELEHAEVVIVSVVGIEPPAKLGVEVLRAVDIGDGDDNDL